MKLTEYIEKYYGGNKSEFARSNGVLPQQVNTWLKMECIVIDGKLYSPRRDLAPVDLKK